MKAWLVLKMVGTINIGGVERKLKNDRYLAWIAKEFNRD